MFCFWIHAKRYTHITLINGTIYAIIPFAKRESY